MAVDHDVKQGFDGWNGFLHAAVFKIMGGCFFMSIGDIHHPIHKVIQTLELRLQDFFAENALGFIKILPIYL